MQAVMNIKEQCGELVVRDKETVSPSDNDNTTPGTDYLTDSFLHPRILPYKYPLKYIYIIKFE